MEYKAYITPNPMTPNQCVAINPDLCIACNSCVDVCRSYVMLPNNEKGMPPYVIYPDECWFCGCCITHCPHGEEGAIEIVTPFQMRGSFKRSTE